MVSRDKVFSLDKHDRFYLAVALFLAVLTSASFVAFLILTEFPEPTISPDDSGYVSVTDYLKGEDVTLDKLRISRPIVPILALPLSYVVDTRVSFIITNAIFFVVLVGAFYVLARDLLGESRPAFYSTLLLIFAYPVYYRGINVTVDLVSWLIFVSLACLILHYKKRNLLTLRVLTVMAVGCAVGTLVTELVLVSFLLVFVLYVLDNFRKHPPGLLLRNLLIIGFSFTIPILIFQIVIYLIFDYSIFDNAEKKMEWVVDNPLSLGPSGLIRAFIGAFNVSLLFVPLGVFEFWKKNRHVNIHLAMLVSVLVGLLGIYINTVRFVFVLFPLVFTFAIRGVMFFVSKLQIAVSASERQTRLAQAALVAGMCVFNVLLYVGFLQYGSTMAMARRFLSLLL